jgi:hypothetical protein
MKNRVVILTKNGDIRKKVMLIYELCNRFSAKLTKVVNTKKKRPSQYNEIASSFL